MKHMIFRHRVEDFDRWLGVYEEDAPGRAAAGIREKFVMRDARDPQVVVMWFEVADPAAVMAFTATPEAAETGARAGAVGPMESWTLVEDGA